MIDKIVECTKCPLSCNQKPLLDERRKADVIWLGISAKLLAKNCIEPLDPNTISGKVISDIEKKLPTISFYSSNLVKCAPINNEGVLRAPSKKEITSCLTNLEIEIKELRPKIIVLLGERTASAVLKSINIRFSSKSSFIRGTVKHQGISYVAVDHPSYIYVYKRKYIEEYVQIIKTHLYNIVFNNEL